MRPIAKPSTHSRSIRFWGAHCAPALLVALAATVEAQSVQPDGSNPVSPPIANIRCPNATLTNEAPELRAALSTAMADACAILESDQFRATIENLRLARKCPILPFKKHKRLPGPEIYRKLADGMPSTITVTAEKVGWSSTIAVTNTARRSITIKPDRFSEWLGSEPSDRAGMINTLVHEMTHLVEPTPGAGFAYFQDGGQWTPWCNEDLLVSYALGDEAAAQWIATHR
jgi:hypothetical protein